VHGSRSRLGAPTPSRRRFVKARRGGLRRRGVGRLAPSSRACCARDGSPVPSPACRGARRSAAGPKYSPARALYRDLLATAWLRLAHVAGAATISALRRALAVLSGVPPRRGPPASHAPMLETLASSRTAHRARALEIEAGRGVRRRAVLSTLADRRMTASWARRPACRFCTDDSLEFLEAFGLPRPCCDAGAAQLCCGAETPPRPEPLTVSNCGCCRPPWPRGRHQRISIRPASVTEGTSCASASKDP